MAVFLKNYFIFQGRPGAKGEAGLTVRLSVQLVVGYSLIIVIYNNNIILMFPYFLERGHH